MPSVKPNWRDAFQVVVIKTRENGRYYAGVGDGQHRVNPGGRDLRDDDTRRVFFGVHHHLFECVVNVLHIVS